MVERDEIPVQQGDCKTTQSPRSGNKKFWLQLHPAAVQRRGHLRQPAGLYQQGDVNTTASGEATDDSGQVAVRSAAPSSPAGRQQGLIGRPPRDRRARPGTLRGKRGAPAEDRRTDAHHGAAGMDRRFEVAAHAHGQGVQPQALRVESVEQLPGARRAPRRPQSKSGAGSGIVIRPRRRSRGSCAIAAPVPPAACGGTPALVGPPSVFT